MRSFKALAAILLISGCGSSPDTDEDAASTEATAEDSMINIGDAAEPLGRFPDAKELKGGETYSQYDERRDSYAGARGSYAGDGCTEDCSGHEAGYQWAEARDINDPDDCGGKSWSFEEGCRAYAKEQEIEEASGGF